MSGAEPAGHAGSGSAQADPDDLVDGDVVDAELVEDDGAGQTEEYPDITTDDPLDEELVEMVQVAETIAAERDEYLDLARRVQADFENYKRRVDIQRAEQRERAAESLAKELLPVLDAGEAAVAQGMEDVTPLYTQLLATLEKQGLAQVVDDGVEFDPNIHEAVMHEEGGDGTPVVAEVLRTGYLWNQRVLRPAMVKVRG